MNSLIWTIEENCMGCNKCILTCPVDDANMSYVVNGKSKIHINANRCIMCGKCMEVCDHKARDYSDDTAEFFRHLMKGEQISIVAAPAFKTNYPEYGRMISFLKTMGVKHVFDVALGADITIWAYLKTLEENQKKPIISQPCPAIVNYVQKYEHDLIDRLAPVQSPLVCLGIYLNKYMNVKDKLCFLSPCIAKASEIHDENTHGYISYNVTFRKLSEYLEAHNIKLSDYEEAELEQPARGLGEIFSKPGGLKENLQLYDRTIWVKQMEGVEHVYNYLTEYSHRLSRNQSLPTVVDALNCDFGCNIGSGACTNADITGVDEISHELLISKLEGGTPPDAENIRKRFDEQLVLEDFRRVYTGEILEETKEPTEEDYNDIFNSMFKFTEESRSRNCFACGYRSCHHMAKAIYNRLNHKENCIDNCSAMMLQQMHELEDQYSETELLLEEVQQQSEELFEANERMTELSNIKSDFVSTISQELQAPLTSVLGRSKVVKKRLDEVVLPEIKSEDEKVMRTVKQVADNLNSIISEGERITALINDIMDIAKIESGKMVSKGGKISVAKIIEREIEGQQHPSSKKTLAKYLREHAASAIPSENGDKKILIIDSEDGTRKFLRGEFERRGYIVYEAADGIEAIECIKVIKPEVITLDVMMPSMNGFDFAAIIKNDPKTKNIPIIILSTIEDRERGLDIGVDGYLTKPVDITVLMKEVEKLLSR